MQHGYQLCVHAIGDRANRETLNIFEEAFKANPDKKDLRWRVEHAQHLNPADIPRFGALGVIASMQGIHCTSDAPYVLARLGPKRAEEGAYVWQKLMKIGRRRHQRHRRAGRGRRSDRELLRDCQPQAEGWKRLLSGPAHEPHGGAEVLHASTARSRRSRRARRGSLKAGKYADMVVLSKDILTIPEDEIPSAQVVYTIVGGKVRYKRQ